MFSKKFLLCLKGRHEMIDAVVDKLTIPNFLPTGDVKFNITFSDEKKNMLGEVAAFVYLKTGSLQQIF
jgi:hypothetical protein